MQSAHAGLRKRVSESVRRASELRERLTGNVDSSALRRIADELIGLVDQLELTFSDLGQALDEQQSRRAASVAAQQRAETLFRLAPMPSVGIDAEGSIVEINDAAARLLNIAPRHIIGRAFPVFLAGDRPAFLNALTTVIRTGHSTSWHAALRPRDRGPIASEIVMALDPPAQALLLIHTQEDSRARTLADVVAASSVLDAAAARESVSEATVTPSR